MHPEYAEALNQDPLPPGSTTPVYASAADLDRGGGAVTYEANASKT